VSSAPDPHPVPVALDPAPLSRSDGSAQDRPASLPLAERPPLPSVTPVVEPPVPVPSPDPAHPAAAPRIAVAWADGPPIKDGPSPLAFRATSPHLLASPGIAAGEKAAVFGLDAGAAQSTPPDLIGPMPAAFPDVRVRVNAPHSVPERDIRRAMNALAAAGLVVEGPFRVNFSISRTNARYYHTGDAPAATAAAVAATSAAGGAAVEARDFTHAGRRPPEGTVELWLAGRAPQRPAPAAAPPTARPPANPIQQFGRDLDRLVGRVFRRE
jgi:hypothetical protein